MIAWRMAGRNSPEFSASIARFELPSSLSSATDCRMARPKITSPAGLKSVPKLFGTALSLIGLRLVAK
jgi:hypothetical protein